MEKIEKELINYYKKDIDIPESFEKAMKSALDEQKYNLNSKIKYVKYIAIVLLISILSTNIISFAYSYYRYKANNTIGYVTDSMESAIENGYIQNIDMEYSYYKDVGVRVNYVVMSDYNLNILFDIKSDNTNINNGSLLLKDLIIYDENKNIIFCYDIDTIKNFAKVNFINWKNKDGSFNQYADGFGNQVIEKDENTHKFLYKIRSLKGFPKSKKLFLSFSSIYDFREDKEIFSGRWNIELNLDEKFYNRENIYYSIEESKNNSKNIEWAEVITTDTITRATVYLKEKITNGAQMYLKDRNGNVYSENNIEDYLSIQKNIISATFSINKLQNIDIEQVIVKIDNKEEYIYLKRN